MTEISAADSKRLTVKQVATLLGYHCQTIYKWARLGMIPCIRQGRKGRAIRFKLSDIQAWEQEQTTGKL